MNIKDFIEKSVEELHNHPAMKFANDAITLQAIRSGTSGYQGEENLVDWYKANTIALIEMIGKEKDGAYRERDMLVCALSKLFPSYLARHDDSDKEWEDDWRWIVYISLPTGQVSWHIHDSEREMFNHLEVKENNWDGHNTQRKYERLQALSSLQDLKELKK